MTITKSGAQPEPTKKVGDISVMVEMLNAKLVALEKNWNLLIDSIQPVLSQCSPPNTTLQGGVEVSSPVATELKGFITRLDVLIDSVGDAYERNQL